VRKDVVELLCRLFDRRRLTLVPALQFTTPLPALELERRRTDPRVAGLSWVGPDGKTWQETYPTQRGMAPYYNVLHPAVQQAMIDVVREVAQRYGRHPSFAGLGIQLSARGYAQLPGPRWGMDDRTIGQFQQETDIRVPGDGPGRFAQRAQFLATAPQCDIWLRWRADKLHAFHARVQRELTSIRPDARLYLAGSEWFASEPMTAALRPTLDRRLSAEDALLQAGIGAEQYGTASGPTLLRSRRRPMPWPTTLDAIDREIALAPDFDRLFDGRDGRGALWFHPPVKRRISSLDEKSPWQPCYGSFFAQPVPSAAANRCRFARTLAADDVGVVFDGGWMLPMGQEAATRPWFEAFRRLPNVPFKTVATPGRSTQPVVFRYATCGGETYAYAVNDAPFPVETRVLVDAPSGCRVEELTGRRPISPLESGRGGQRLWRVRLQPHELVAMRLNAPHVQLTAPETEVPRHVARSLEQRVSDLGLRAAALHSVKPKPLLENPGFEQEPTESGRIPGWTVVPAAGDETSVRLETGNAHEGQRGVRMRSEGPAVALASRRVPVPPTGRLSMSVWLRVPEGAPQPPLRLAVEGDFGRLRYRFAPVGAPIAEGQPAVPIGTRWSQFVFPVSDLPLDPDRRVSIRFDLMGPGEVWIDHVEVFDLALDRQELVELSKLITLIDVKRQNGQVADCLHLLEGHWPRLLERHVPLPETGRTDGLADHPSREQRAPPQSTGDRTGLLDRMQDLLPKKLW
jgi:hypothetical protein